MAGPLRKHFHDDLEEIDQKVVQLFALVIEGIAAATDAFLSGDRDAARALIARDKTIDSLYNDIQELARRQFALQAPVAADLRFLLAVLRMVPDLERTGDLAEHIAQSAKRGLTSELTPRVRGLVEQLGRVDGELWRDAAEAYHDHDPSAADRLAERDDEVDSLHTSLMSELASGRVPLPIAIEMALVARFFERIGDHAVNTARRVRYLIEGD